MIAMIPAITERKVQRSYQSCGNHSTVIAAVTVVLIAEVDFSSIFVPYGNHSPAITMIVVIV